MGQLIDLTGKTFGEWEVLQYLGSCEWECKCSCGEVRAVNGSNLRSGRSQRCGICSGREQPMEGRRFGRLTVLRRGESQRYTSPDGKSRYTRVMWVCKCSCGNPDEVIVSGDHLRNQGTKSCGCLRAVAASKKRTHGMTVDGPDGGPTAEYQMWARAKRRAEAEGFPFEIQPTDVVIPETCAVFGWPLEIGDGASQDQSPSLDRLIPEKGYVKGNVWVISHLANRIKNNATLEQLEAVTAALKKVLSAHPAPRSS